MSATNAVLRFFALTYAATWACFFGAMAVGASPDLAALRWSLLLLGAFMPSAVAVCLTWRDEGGAGVKALLRRLWQWRVGARWYVFALGYMLGAKLIVAAAYRAITGAWPPYTGDAWYVILAALVPAAILGGPLGEEIGWRGYALPRLAQRMGMARASVLLGVAWACWHLPVFFIPGIDQYGQSIFVYVLRVTALSIAMAWLYRHTNGSLLLAVLMHAAINQTKDVASSVVPGARNPFAIPASLTAWLTVAVLWIAGLLLLRRMSRADASDRSLHAASPALDASRAVEVR